MGFFRSPKWYGYDDPVFRHWFHEDWKVPGSRDADKDEIEAAFEEWVNRGKPNTRPPRRFGVKKLGKRIFFPLTMFSAVEGYSEGGIRGAAENVTGLSDISDMAQYGHDCLENHLRDKTPFERHRDQLDDVLGAL